MTAPLASFREKPFVRRMNRIIFRIVAPVLGAALVIYACFSPSVIQLDDDYYFAADGIRVTGGTHAVGPGKVRLWGRYPWVYGTVDGKGFAVNLKEAEVEIFASPEKYLRFLEEEKLNPVFCKTYQELSAKENTSLRLSLKGALSVR